MKVCIFGAGAIGGYLGAGLARTDHEVSLIARGTHLRAMRERGITVLKDGTSYTSRPNCTDDPAALGPQDYLIVTLKAHSVIDTVDAMRPLLGPNTTVVTAYNGIPYWYFHGVEGKLRNHVLESVDPGGRQWEILKPERAVGCIVYPATEVVEPGVIKHVYGDKFPVGEPSGQITERLTALSALIEEGGFKAGTLDSIRDEIWLKLWGNLCFNPISALTLATLDIIAFDPDTRPVARAMMEEARIIAEKLGVHFRVDVERRIDGAGKVGAHKTSMLQDLERNRPLEIDALITVVQEMGRLTETPTPTLDVVLALVRQRARVAGLYPPIELLKPAPKPAKIAAG